MDGDLLARAWFHVARVSCARSTVGADFREYQRAKRSPRVSTIVKAVFEPVDHWHRDGVADRQLMMVLFTVLVELSQ